MGMIFLVLMTIIISYQVFTRYFLNSTPYWSEEIALLLMVWFSFIGIALGVKRETHLSIEFLVNKLSQKPKKILYIVSHCLECLFGIIVFIYGAKLVSLTKTSTLPATQLKTSFLYLMVPVAGVMITIYAVMKIVQKLKNKNIINNL